VFTGIVEEVGAIVAADPFETGIQFRVEASRVLDGLQLGDSVSISGACHTITGIFSDGFSIQSVATTLQRTTLGSYTIGRRINLERSLAMGARLHGHLVQGHVDGVGAISSITDSGDHVLIDFTIPPIVADVSLLHGSITVDGVSLTINALPSPGFAQVSIIPHTWLVTSFPDLRVGSVVNLEGDLIGKYVRHIMTRSNEAAPLAAGSVHLEPGRGYQA